MATLAVAAICATRRGRNRSSAPKSLLFPSRAFFTTAAGDLCCFGSHYAFPVSGRSFMPSTTYAFCFNCSR